MASQDRSDERLDELRRRAEEILAAAEAPTRPGAGSRPLLTSELLHEIQVYQTELEMQNEDLRLAREELQTSRDRYKMLYDYAPVGYVTLTPAGLISSANLTFAAMLHRSVEMLNKGTKAFSSLIVPASRQAFYRILNARASGEDQLQFLRSDGDTLWGLLRVDPSFHKDGALAEYWLTVVDISGRRQADLARDAALASLRRERNLLQAIMDAVRDIHLVYLDRDFNFVRVNRAYAATCGYTSDEMIGRNHFDLYPHPENKAIFARVRDTGIPAEFRDKPFEFPDQPERGVTYWDWTLTPVKGEDGHVEGLVFALIETTQRVRAEADLRQARDDLEERVRQRTQELRRRADQLARLAAELTTAEQRERRRIAEVLHDHLQQLLVAASMRADLVRSSFDGPARASLDLVHSIIAEAIDASRSLSYDLSPPVLRHTSLVEALRWLANWMADRHRFRVRVTADADVDIPREDLRLLLFQSVREFLFNAVKHSGVDHADVAASRGQDGVPRILVSDEGRGFDPAAVAAAADQAARALGLSSIRDRLDLLGARIDIDSAPGRGARFTILLPLDYAEEEAAPPPPQRLARRAASAGNPFAADRLIRVMLVDDHEVMRHGVASFLAGQDDIEVVGEAASGEAALDIVAALHPDVVIMDFGLPGIDGAETTRRLLALCPQTRVIALSMFEEADRARAMLAAGASAFITKSEDPGHLLDAIRDR